jgi:hypothetical protein
MTKNLKGMKQKKESYILNSIDGLEYGIDLKDDRHKLEFVLNTFKAEFVHEYNLKKFNNNLTLIFEDYLRGLPSCINVHFYNSDILKIGLEWGYNLDTDYKENDFINRWFRMLANTFFQMLNKHKINY